MNYCNFFVISWLPKYLVEVVGLSLEESGTFLLLPYIAPFGGVLLAGQVSDALIRRGWKVVHVRKTLQTVSDVGQAVRAATVGLVCDCCRGSDSRQPLLRTGVHRVLRRRGAAECRGLHRDHGRRGLLPEPAHSRLCVPSPLPRL